MRKAASLGRKRLMLLAVGAGLLTGFLPLLLFHTKPASALTTPKRASLTL